MSAALLQTTHMTNTRYSTLAADGISRRARIAGWTLSVILLALLAFDAGIKLVGAKAAVEGTLQLGYPASAVFVIGVLALVCWILYAIPRTAPLGALLWTGYFGGTVATHIRAGNPLFTHILSGVYVATLLWVALWLRDARVRRMATGIVQGE